MQQRIDVTKVSPAAYQAVAAIQSYVDKSGLDPKLRELIKIRVSQINGCAYCLAMHTRDARKLGEADERMHLLNAWREAPLYSARERAALGWVEAVTLVTQGHLPVAAQWHTSSRCILMTAGLDAWLKRHRSLAWF